MSSSIWTRCAGDSELRAASPLAVASRRGAAPGVDAQARRLGRGAGAARGADRARQAARRSPAAGCTICCSLPSAIRRCRTARASARRHERGIWYGSESTAHGVRRGRVLSAALSRGDARRARRGDDARSPRSPSRARSARGVDLVAPPFDAHRKRDRVADELRVVTGARRTRCEPRGSSCFAIRRRATREGGVNVGAFAPAVFGTCEAARLRDVALHGVRENGSRSRRATISSARSYHAFRASSFSSTDCSRRPRCETMR